MIFRFLYRFRTVSNCANLPSLSMGSVRNPIWNKAKVYILNHGLNYVKICWPGIILAFFRTHEQFWVYSERKSLKMYNVGFLTEPIQSEYILIEKVPKCTNISKMSMGSKRHPNLYQVKLFLQNSNKDPKCQL